MADINRDLDRYLRKRGHQPTGYSGPSWFDRVFSSAEKEEQETLAPEEAEVLDEMEDEIKHGEEELEVVHEMEHEIEDEQEERVGLYHQVARFFRRNKEPAVEQDEVEVFEEPEDLEDDFRALARIQVRWLSRLPLRARQAFQDSDDYQTMVEIYERRGVARRKE